MTCGSASVGKGIGRLFSLRSVAKLASRCLFLAALVPALAMALPSCAQGFIRSGQVFRGNYVRVYSPKSEEWRLLGSNSSGMQFGRDGAEPGERFTATVFMNDLPEFEDGEDFLALVTRGNAAAAEEEDYEIVQKEFLASTERSYPCVRLVFRGQRHPIPTESGSERVFLVEAYSLFCRHLVRQDTYFRIEYMFEGWSEYPDLRAEAEDFFRGVQVPGH